MPAKKDQPKKTKAIALFWEKWLADPPVLDPRCYHTCLIEDLVRINPDGSLELNSHVGWMYLLGPCRIEGEISGNKLSFTAKMYNQGKANPDYNLQVELKLLANEHLGGGWHGTWKHSTPEGQKEGIVFLVFSEF
jgi:hypothetical protein